MPASIRTPVLLASLPLALLLGSPSGPPADLDELRLRLRRSLDEGAVENAERHVAAIGAVDGREAAEFLIDLARGVHRRRTLNDGEKLRVYRAVVEALSGLTDPEARDVIIGRLARLRDPDDSRKKVFLAEVISGMQGKEAEAALIGLVRDEQFPAVQVLAIESLGKRWSADAVPRMIALLEVEETRGGLVWRAALDALREITGESLRTSHEWKRFWEIRGPTFDPANVAREPPPRDPHKTVPRAFDPKTLLLARRAVFVIDVSFSMHIKDPPLPEVPVDLEEEQDARKTRERPNAPKRVPPRPPPDDLRLCPVCGKVHGGVGLPDQRMRIERVKGDLGDLVRALRPGGEFNIVAFSGKISPWRRGGRLATVSRETQGDAIRWIRRLTYDGGTSTDLALAHALEHEEANAIYLLSDGRPFRGSGFLPTDRILEQVAWWNRDRKVKIFTYGFSRDADEEFLRALAYQNGGTYTSVR